ncbi:ABC transporter permease [Paenibacillus cremeus]|uniref:Sugar ABC transporter permease n=1 Tax=Paenibacillus cremeus TaxID=2163881 RepID=A0A559KIW4_9BACL|nr:ABC transporter permease subunit [Paenibacillus cremeus]TVY12018.1 sugar ABC transporter permease [Paenibacillus cremeus]
MKTDSIGHPAIASTAAPAKRKWRSLFVDWDLYLLMVPGFLFFLLFKYLPMWGIIIAFQDYSPFQGIVDSTWVGFKHFVTLFTYEKFWLIFRNTIVISFYNLIFFFPAPIILSLLLNELRMQVFKRFVQTVIYIPHFVSWVVVAGMTYLLLGTQGGLVNELVKASGGEALPFLTTPEWFRGLIVSQSIWKEAGWGTIIFLAALTGVDPQLYEAAIVDGAGRWRQLWHVTLPAIRSTIFILLILRLGNILDVGFEHIFLMLNSTVTSVGDVFETYVYREGLVGGKFSFTTAVGLFKSVVGLVLVVGANWLAKRFGEEGVY